MTYIISLALMAAGLVLLTWTFAAAVRLKREQEALPLPDFHSTYAIPVSADYERELSERESLAAKAGSASTGDWYQLQCKASRGVRYAPDMGGFTEVPLQLHDAYDNRMYVRKRIWVN
jgi:hypothetical protein